MFNKILDLAVNRGFLIKALHPKINVEQYKLGPVGLLLLHNLETEWFNHFVVNKDVSVFMNKDDFVVTLDLVKRLCLDRLPLGIAERTKGSNTVNLEQLMTLQNDNKIDFATQFPVEEEETFKCTYFVSPTQSTKFFHQFQRQRRMWWRKISATPGRYHVTDISTSENGSQTSEIQAHYPWAEQQIEKMVLNHTDGLDDHLQFKDGKKIVQPHTVTSTINLSVLLLNAFCDAFDEPLFQGKPRTILRFHRKLAPYRISFAVSGTNSSLSELSDLALYLCRQLRANHVSSLLLPSATRLSLDAQYKQFDQLGVPYTALLNESTLRDGVLHLRNRDTTLKEQVHVTNLVTYMEQLLKNY